MMIWHADGAVLLARTEAHFGGARQVIATSGPLSFGQALAVTLFTANATIPSGHAATATARVASFRSRRAVEVAEQYADREVNEAVRSSEWNRVLNANRDNPYRKAWLSVLPESALEDPINLPRLVQRAERSGVAPTIQAALLRDIIGNPFRQVAIGKKETCSCSMYGRNGWVIGFKGTWEKCDCCNGTGKITKSPSWLTWEDGKIVSMAQKMYDSRDFAGMPILADALEEAGYVSPHCVHCVNGVWGELESGETIYCNCVHSDLLRHLRGPGPHVRGCWVIDLLLGKE